MSQAFKDRYHVGDLLQLNTHTFGNRGYLQLWSDDENRYYVMGTIRWDLPHDPPPILLVVETKWKFEENSVSLKLLADTQCGWLRFFESETEFFRKINK